MHNVSEPNWSRELWDASISARAYNPDWWHTLTPEKEPGLWAQMHAIYNEEQTLGEIPSWATEVVVRMMELPMCGYYAFPDNVMQIVDAISAERCPDVVMRCYTVDPDRKTLMSYYVFCLDAWEKGAPLANVIAELSLRDALGRDWTSIATAIYHKLGERTDLKGLVIRRLIHRLRWWIKSLIWMEDKRDKFMLDFYGGDIRGEEHPWGSYGNSPYGDPYFTELQLPHIKVLEDRILAEVDNGKELLVRIHSTWLCAPKVFRYLEKLIAEIGAIGTTLYNGVVPSFLQCENTYPNFSLYHQHYEQLVDKLQLWLNGQNENLPLLEKSPVQHWLVHILWHKLVFFGTYEEVFGKMVGTQQHGKTGTKLPA